METIGISRTTRAPADGNRWRRLASKVSGAILSPRDPGYDTARSGFNLCLDQYPAVIVAARTPADVLTAVAAAREERLDICVQATGHGVSTPANRKMLITTSGMKTVRVDPSARTARVGAGARWADVLEAAQPFGLAPLLGSSPDVGAVGYTLGGGFGWLGRRWGLAADSVHAFDVVTVDGRSLRASRTENPDLFWGLRGGGGSLCIVTGMEIRLYPVSSVYGGNLYYPVEQAPEVMARFRDWIGTAPDELTSSVLIQHVPPMPSVPEVLRGKSFAIVRGCFCGDLAEGERLLGTWRQWQAPLIDAFAPMSFGDVATISNDPREPVPACSSGSWLRALNDEVIDTIVRHAAPRDGVPPVIFAEVRHAGGAISRVPPDAGAYGNRDRTLLLQFVGFTPTAEARQALAAFTDRFKQALEPWLAGVYMNFLEGHESRLRIREAYSPEALARLAGLKAAYDPENRLRSGFNIPVPC